MMIQFSKHDLRTKCHCLNHIWHIGTETKWPPISWRHLKCIFLNEKKTYILINISVKFILKIQINNVPALLHHHHHYHRHRPLENDAGSLNTISITATSWRRGMFPWLYQLINLIVVYILWIYLWNGGWWNSSRWRRSIAEFQGVD